MRGLPVAASVAIGLGLLHCGTNSSGSGSVVPAADSGTNSDGGTAADGGGSTDAGSGSDGGVASDGGMSTDGGTSDGGTATDGGTASSDCDGLAPGAPGMATEFRWMNRDLNNNSGGSCFPAETDGTGHIAVSWQNPFQPHDSRFAFVDPASASEAGSYMAVGMLLIGQASGFMGGQCGGTICAENYVVLDPVGKELFQSPFGHGNNVQANDPTGGMIHVRFSESGEGTTMLLDAIDPSGAIRWTRPLPDVFGPQDSKAMRLGVDRQGNVLALWSSAPRYGAGTWAGQWFDHAGTPGSARASFRTSSTSALATASSSPGRPAGWGSSMRRRHRCPRRRPGSRRGRARTCTWSMAAKATRSCRCPRAAPPAISRSR